MYRLSFIVTVYIDLRFLIFIRGEERENMQKYLERREEEEQQQQGCKIRR